MKKLFNLLVEHSEKNHSIPHKTIGMLGAMLSLLFIPFSGFMIFKPRVVPGFVSALFFGFLLLVGCEFSSRIFVNLFKPNLKKEIATYAFRTYPLNQAYIGHPFLQFTGRPSASLIVNEALGGLTPFNNLGFRGKDFVFEKAANTIRIAALGESTTADGYPEVMETFLNAKKNDRKHSFEVLNLGMCGTQRRMQ